jgi:pimeloyl-ACP methyl ester carboxylesterase
MATFVLIHGAWHGAWCWERVAPLLVAEGHRVLAPDLPGMGADRCKHGSDPLSTTKCRRTMREPRWTGSWRSRSPHSPSR